MGKSSGGGSASVDSGIIVDPKNWGTSMGHDFRAAFQAQDIVTANVPQTLADHGWVMSNVVVQTDGVGNNPTGDFNSQADDMPYALLMSPTNPSAAQFASPYRFLGWQNFQAAAVSLGSVPTQFRADMWIDFQTIAGLSSVTNFFGLHPAGFATSTGPAIVYFNGTNWVLDNGAVTDVGTAIPATGPKKYSLVFDGTNVTFYIDDVQDAQVAQPTDLYPCGFHFRTDDDTRLEMKISHLRAFYS